MHKSKQTGKILNEDLSLYMTCFVAGPAPLPPWQSQAPGYGAPPPPGYPPFHGPPLPPPSDNHWVSQSLSSDLLFSLLVFFIGWLEVSEMLLVRVHP